MKFRQMDEGFEWVFKAETADEQVTRLKQWAGTNQALVPLVRIGVGAENPDWRLPDGMPDTVKIDEEMPDGMGSTTIQLEWRRIKQFFDPESNMNNLPDWKREMNWLQILEGLHHSEAKILTAIKDGKLLKAVPQLKKLMKPLGIEDYNGKPKARSRKNVKS